MVFYFVIKLECTALTPQTKDDLKSMKKCLLGFLCLSFFSSVNAQSLDSQGLDEILADIQQLEGARDPKCYATASRLEDFM